MNGLGDLGNSFSRDIAGRTYKPKAPVSKFAAPLVIHPLALFEVAHFSHEVATAHSLGRKPKGNAEVEARAAKRRQQIGNVRVAVTASRLAGHEDYIPWANAHGYVLPSLRD